MTRPQATDYSEAVQNPATAFADVDLRQGRVAANALGLPLIRSGNFAAVFELATGAADNKWAAKCFTRQVPGLQERYRLIDAHLSQQHLPFMVGFEYLPDGILVQGQRYPLLKMDWVEGLRLDEFLADCLTKQNYKLTLGMLCQMWLKMARILHEADVGHGDLQHGNVLLVPAAEKGGYYLRLIDYDGMYVPALADAPGDSAANTAVGRYYCFIKGDWKTGLPYLAKGDHAEQRQISQRELANAPKPDEAIEIADGWFAMAGDEEAFLTASVALQKENLLRHALALYHHNVTRLPESKRRYVESQIEDLKRQLTGDASPPHVSRAIWYMQDVSMKPFPVGQRGDLRQTTDDPRAPFGGQGVYFDQSGRRDDIVFQVEWDKQIRTVQMSANNLKNFHVQFLSFDGKRVISQSSVVKFSSELQSINFPMPSNIGSRFCMRLHNEAGDWFYLDRVELRKAP